MKNIKCRSCFFYRNEWCEKIVDSPDPEEARDCNYFREMTNADRINAMTIEEKAEFLSSIAYSRETPWCEQFAEKFCKSCPSTTCTVEGHHHPMDLHECDFTDGKCPHGEDIVWWLQQPCGEEDKHEAD